MATPFTYQRQDSIVTGRPYGVEVDEDGWLWEGVSKSRLIAHNLKTGELKVFVVPEMQNTQVYSIFAWGGRLLLVMGNMRCYLIFDPKTGVCVSRDLPGENPICWYGTRLPGNRVMLFDRGNSQALILDHIDAVPRAVKADFAGDFAAGSLEEDGLVYCFMGTPTQMVRFDPAKERFLEAVAIPYPDSGISGRFSHEGVFYGADSSGGRILRMEMKSGKWLEPITHPDYGKVFGFIGMGSKVNGKGYFCLSNYGHRSRLDPKTGAVIVPPGGEIGVDGKSIRFLDKMLVLDLATHGWEYLSAPEQPDGVPLLCYQWTDGKRFAVTSVVQQHGEPGLIRDIGAWAVLHNFPVEPAPGFTSFDFSHDRFRQMRLRANGYFWQRSVFLPEEGVVPAVGNMAGPAMSYEPGRDRELLARAKATDAKAYWAMILKTVLPKDDESPAAKFKAILGHVNRYIYYNPIQVPTTFHPIAIHQAREGRCGHAAGIVRAMCEAAGLEVRMAPLQNHTVTEAFYDGAWHMGDALFFGASQPSRDGRILSIEEVKAEPYFADKYPQWCFVYPPELVSAEDGYQVEGYVFGLWGSEPYYSFYLGAPKDQPPTRPAPMPAQRLSADTVRLNWGRSIKHGLIDAVIEYDVKVFADRAAKEEVFHAVTRETHADFRVPKGNWMYFLHVKAMDDHRQKNAETWYPASVWNFVHVPKEQYGWYGVL